MPICMHWMELKNASRCAVLTCWTTSRSLRHLGLVRASSMSRFQTTILNSWRQLLKERRMLSTLLAADMGVQRVVYTSSYGAVHMNPNRSPEQIVDESCWSDLEFCLKTKNYYCFAKAVAEKTAMEEASKRGIQLVAVVPLLTLGETLQPALNLGIYLLIVSYMKGAKKAYPNAVSGFVDVQDVARAHVLVYQTPAAHGRYLCIGDVLHRS